MSNRLRAATFKRFTLSTFGVVLVLVACGGRSVEDFNDKTASAGGTAGQDDAGAGADGGTGGSGTTGSTGSGGRVGTTGGTTGSGTGGTGFGGFGGIPGLDGGLDGAAAACLECVTTSCPDAQECLTNPACIQGGLCAATMCLSQGTGGGSADGLGCWLSCFDGDTTTALSAFSAFSCVLSSCGTDCTSAFMP